MGCSVGSAPQGSEDLGVHKGIERQENPGGGAEQRAPLLF